VRVGIITFPGTTAARDAAVGLRAAGAEPESLWWTDTDFDHLDALVLPGGSSHGDALRPGAIAARAPVFDAIRRFAATGAGVLGIGNGFQMLTEAGLLPGALLLNESGRFMCDTVRVNLVGSDEQLDLPIAHSHGRYVAGASVLTDLNEQDRIVLRYLDEVNGSVERIAGVRGENRNVIGVMVRPERATDALLGGEDGLSLFRALLPR